MPVAAAGKTCKGKSRGLAGPADTKTSTSRGGLKLPYDGVKPARPFISVRMLARDARRITGVDAFTEFVSPLPGAAAVPPLRLTAVRNKTGAATTRLGGVAESVLRTIIGWSACPAETCPAPAAGCSLCMKGGTALT